METRLQIKLSPEDRNALQGRAEKELRDLHQQAQAFAVLGAW